MLNLNKLSQFNGLSTNSQNYSSMKNRPLPATPGHTQKTGETDHVRMNKERPKPPPKPKKKPQTSNGDLNHQNDTINSHEFEGEDGTEV